MFWTHKWNRFGGCPRVAGPRRSLSFSRKEFSIRRDGHSQRYDRRPDRQAKRLNRAMAACDAGRKARVPARANPNRRGTRPRRARPARAASAMARRTAPSRRGRAQKCVQDPGLFRGLRVRCAISGNFGWILAFRPTPRNTLLQVGIPPMLPVGGNARGCRFDRMHKERLVHDFLRAALERRCLVVRVQVIVPAGCACPRRNGGCRDVHGATLGFAPVR